MKTKIIIERHGQSEGNADRIYLGHTDFGLTAEGERQAKITAEHLKDEKIDAIYSSDLKRAYQTALPHASLRGMEIVSVPDLREMFVGDWEEKQIPDLIRDYGDEFSVRRFYVDFRYPGGESIREAMVRMNDAVTEIARANLGKTVLLVSHSAAIRALWYYISGATCPNMLDAVSVLPNAAYAVAEFDGERLIPVEYGIADHLPSKKFLA
ncbi:MAG: histidine phosphatase family protein [Clostridia bacterium]|nr:histidine phosphatase family protein [Clostridia bacterium]